ncbi:MAG TPA: WecB/TagA/CpsF family glycosyltransferase, partial [Patescibacteria group bacterium]|nr:WecB/TagA/CpsF family glycosyltransferase [Patescibacteria group bacterium]
MDSFYLFDVRFDDLSHKEWEGQVLEWLRGKTPRVIVTPNPEFLLEARDNPVFRDLLNRADLSLPDGVGIRFACAALADHRLRSRHPGVDVLLLLAEICAREKKRLVLVGGRDGSEKKTVDRLRNFFPALEVTCVNPGKVRGDATTVEDDAEVVDRIRVLSPDVLVVGLGQGDGKRQGKQERFIRELLPLLPGIRIAIGVGGAFDMIGGVLPRAPERLRRMGLEWL